MGGIPLREIREPARTAWSRLRDRLQSVLDDDLVAMWAHGGSISLDEPAHHGDLDTHVVLARRPDRGTARRIEAAQEAAAREHGVEWDTWYIVVDAARGPDPPPHAWREGRRDTSWALHRAHWLAGRYVNLHGAEPGDLVAPPTWEELEGELNRELEHIERHVVEGDSDPYEATYGILNGSRILRSLATRDVVMSKRDAGAWALEHLPARWEPALRAALRSYDGQRTDQDVELLAAEMSAFVAFVRQHLPPAADRPADVLPRWSGY